IVTSWNLAAEKMFGYTSHEMIGRPITTIIPPELHSDEVMILGKIRRGEKVDHFETVRVAKSGKRVQVSLTVSPVKDQYGRVIGAAKIARDVSERKRAEEALLISEKLASVGRLAATVAHEINNPLAAVVNVVYLIRNSAELPANLRAYATIAEQELNRISALTRQTLGFYRESGGIAPTRVGELAHELATLFSRKAANKSIAVRVQVRSDPEILAVKSEIRQLIANLLGNSIDAVPEKGCISIRVAKSTTYKDQEGVRLTIADSGPGIPADIRESIFEPFFTTKQDVGTGLGLWICKNIVRRHKGSLRLRSRSGEGKSWTVFSIFLPADPARTAEKLASRADLTVQAQLEGPKLLAVQR
ncbi:MAG TPA: ATP-binding protein, partial [Terriglobales bacterium]|nr:ATP-binding protein [Terriglobales bacterium]